MLQLTNLNTRRAFMAQVTDKATGEVSRSLLGLNFYAVINADELSTDETKALKKYQKLNSEKGYISEFNGLPIVVVSETYETCEATIKDAGQVVFINVIDPTILLQEERNVEARKGNYARVIEIDQMIAELNRKSLEYLSMQIAEDAQRVKDKADAVKAKLQGFTLTPQPKAAPKKRAAKKTEPETTETAE